MHTIPLLDSQVIRAALLALVGLIGLILSFFGVDEALFGAKAERVVEALLLVLTTGSVLWAAYARATKPTPPITETAAAKTAEMERQQGGYARPAMLGVLLAVCLVGLTVSGCTGTRAAYKAAKSPDAVAYVVAEQYAVSVKQAADLAALPTTPRSAVVAMQSADRTARPLVEKLLPLRNAYLASKSAANEAQLQVAVNSAVVAVADLILSVKRARGAP